MTSSRHPTYYVVDKFCNTATSNSCTAPCHENLADPQNTLVTQTKLTSILQDNGQDSPQRSHGKGNSEQTASLNNSLLPAHSSGTYSLIPNSSAETVAEQHSVISPTIPAKAFNAANSPSSRAASSLTVRQLCLSSSIGGRKGESAARSSRSYCDCVADGLTKPHNKRSSTPPPFDACSPSAGFLRSIYCSDTTLPVKHAHWSASSTCTFSSPKSTTALALPATASAGIQDSDSQSESITSTEARSKTTCCSVGCDQDNEGQNDVTTLSSHRSNTFSNTSMPNLSFALNSVRSSVSMVLGWDIGGNFGNSCSQPTPLTRRTSIASIASPNMGVEAKTVANHGISSHNDECVLPLQHESALPAETVNCDGSQEKAGSSAGTEADDQSVRVECCRPKMGEAAGDLNDVQRRHSENVSQFTMESQQSHHQYLYSRSNSLAIDIESAANEDTPSRGKEEKSLLPVGSIPFGKLQEQKSNHSYRSNLEIAASTLQKFSAMNFFKDFSRCSEQSERLQCGTALNSATEIAKNLSTSETRNSNTNGRRSSKISLQRRMKKPVFFNNFKHNGQQTDDALQSVSSNRDYNQSFGRLSVSDILNAPLVPIPRQKKTFNFGWGSPTDFSKSIRTPVSSDVPSPQSLGRRRSKQEEIGGWSKKIKKKDEQVNGGKKKGVVFDLRS